MNGNNNVNSPDVGLFKLVAYIMCRVGLYGYRGQRHCFCVMFISELATSTWPLN